MQSSIDQSQNNLFKKIFSVLVLMVELHIKKLLLRQGNIRKRLMFAQEHVNWTEDQWAKELFTDETEVEILEPTVGFLLIRVFEW